MRLTMINICHFSVFQKKSKMGSSSIIWPSDLSNKFFDFVSHSEK